MEKKELDEYMEALWYLSEEEDSSIDQLKKYVKEIYSAEVVSELQKLGFINVENEDKIELTSKGYDLSKQIVRCHRLAERLLADVLGMKPKETEKGACEFEHVIVPEIADSICTLLGHPRECPHGLKIPEGSCCKMLQDTVLSAIVPLARVKIGDLVKVSYINTPSNERMHTFSHFGIIPGAYIKVHQRFPSFVIQCGNTQVAMEEDAAKEIFVLYPSDANEPSSRPGKRKRWSRFRRS
jgi:DtxR family Mn-dependent transcriptional regulator